MNTRKTHGGKGDAIPGFNANKFRNNFDSIFSKKPAFVTYCKTCGKELRLLKDSTEGQAVYCGGCYAKKP